MATDEHARDESTYGAEDWFAWHGKYDGEAHPLQRRLAIVQAALRDELDRREGDDVRIVSMCAGQGRDVIGVLAERRRAGTVRARLVELDERNVDVARREARAAGLEGVVELVPSDAGVLGVYDGAVPADVVLACGVFGNVSDDDLFATIAAIPQLCAPGALVIWTRSRREPDVTPAVRAAFREHSDELDFIAPDDTLLSVGISRFRGPTPPLRSDQRIFTFVPRSS